MNDEVSIVAEGDGNPEMLIGSEAIAAQIEAGFAQAERGELIDAEQAIQILRERRARRRTYQVQA